jgi:excisionase family DNA binding protein
MYQAMQLGRLDQERRTLTAEEARRVAGLSRGLLYELLRQGKIPGAIRVGRRWIIGRRPFLAWLDGEKEDMPVATDQSSLL